MLTSPIKSREYVLEELDRWYTNRMRDNYNDSDFEDAKKILKNLVKSEKFPADFRVKVLSNLEIVSKEAEIKAAELYFSGSFNQMGLVFSSKVLSREEIEFLRPYSLAFGKIHRFVSGVRKRANEIFPENLGKRDIDQGFMKVFGGSSGFNDFYNQNLEGYLRLEELANGPESERYKIVQNIYLDESYINFRRALNYRLFRDLENKS
ncbi:MAG: hypothetical protein AABW73_04415 [Nanoarchaeota archaeon]